MRRSFTSIALGFAACCVAIPALGQSATPRPGSGDGAPPPQVIIDGSGKPCICRAKGRTFIKGASICLNGLVAFCDKEQNVTTWRMTRKACPDS
jgi:hypothetical protein